MKQRKTSKSKRQSKPKKNSRKQSKKQSKEKGKEKSQHGYKGSPILKYSRLPPRDRKYCSCLMSVRYSMMQQKNKSSSKNKSKGKSKGKSRKFSKGYNPYSVCTYSIYVRQKKQRPPKLDCGINYDLDNYELEYLQAYAQERHIPITYKKNGKTTPYSKGQLIQKLRKSMIDKKIAKQKKN